MATLTYTLTLDGIPIMVEYRSVKTLRLTVYPPDGDVNVSAPLGASPAEIKKFVASKITWIKKHQEKFLKSQKEKKLEANESIRNHSTVYVWGEAYELEIIQHTGNSRVKLEDGLMKMFVKPGALKAKKQEVLDRWYRRAIKEKASLRIKNWEQLMGLEVKKLYIRKMKAHWGSCNYKKQTLRLNSELAKRSLEYLDYVIVHEMIHLVEKGHNKNFYSLLEKYLPDWKTTRKKLNAGELS